MRTLSKIALRLFLLTLLFKVTTTVNIIIYYLFYSHCFTLIFIAQLTFHYDRTLCDDM